MHDGRQSGNGISDGLFARGTDALLHRLAFKMHATEINKIRAVAIGAKQRTTSSIAEPTVTQASGRFEFRVPIARSFIALGSEPHL
jgi:hypothetical protein